MNFLYYLKRADPRIFVLDLIALSDEFLSRLPAYKNRWRVGHVFRVLPKGYLNSLLNGGNLVEDIDLHEFYEHLRKIVSGDLFDADILRMILEFNLGKYNKLISHEYEWEEFIGREDIDSLCPAN